MELNNATQSKIEQIIPEDADPTVLERMQQAAQDMDPDYVENTLVPATVAGAVLVPAAGYSVYKQFKDKDLATQTRPMY